MTKKEKTDIALCLISSMHQRKPVDKKTKSFILNWLCTDEKSKDWLEVWDIVLKNYCPLTRPILFRATDHINVGKIESYTGKINTAEKFLWQCGEQGKLIICDTASSICMQEEEEKGKFTHTFFPLGELLKNELNFENTLFRKDFIEDYVGEDEYIMRTKLENSSIYRYVEYEVDQDQNIER